LRQARELREKQKGENLLPEQFEKVIRINELIRQLDNLGFDPEGEPKVKHRYMGAKSALVWEDRVQQWFSALLSLAIPQIHGSWELLYDVQDGMGKLDEFY
jgi:hypothetical protein